MTKGISEIAALSLSRLKRLNEMLVFHQGRKEGQLYPSSFKSLFVVILRLLAGIIITIRRPHGFDGTSLSSAAGPPESGAGLEAEFPLRPGGIRERRGCRQVWCIQHDFPWKSANSQIKLARSRMEISKPAPRFTGSLRLYFSAPAECPRRHRRRKGTHRWLSACPIPVSSSAARLWHRRLFIRAGITCEEAGSKLSFGP